MTSEEQLLCEIVEFEIADLCKAGHEVCYSDEILLRIIRRTKEWCAKIAEETGDWRNDRAFICTCGACGCHTAIATQIRKGPKNS